MFDAENELNKLRYNQDRKFLLMHKDVIVAECTKDIMLKVYEKEHLPYQIQYSEYKYIDWLYSRLIPASRMYYDRLINILSLRGILPIEFIMMNKGLSLTDCYWIKESTDNSSWTDNNYFVNDFNNELISLYLDSQLPSKYENAKLLHPSNSADGNMLKSWIIIDGIRYLVKKPSFENYQTEAEMIAQELLDSINVKHAEYRRYTYVNTSCSASKCMTSKNIEFISAEKCMMLYFGNDEKNFKNIDKFIEKYNCREQVNDMLCLDYIISNIDRHWNNFGILRDANDLTIIGFAPIFDNGSALWYHLSDLRLKTDGFTNENYFLSNMNKSMKISDIKGLIHGSKFKPQEIKSELLGERHNIITEEINRRIKEIM